jgi:hypothetical protein
VRSEGAAEEPAPETGVPGCGPHYLLSRHRCPIRCTPRPRPKPWLPWTHSFLGSVEPKSGSGRISADWPLLRSEWSANPRAPGEIWGTGTPNSVTTTLDLTHGASREGAATQTAAPHTPAALLQPAAIVRLPDLRPLASPPRVKRPVLRHIGPRLRRNRPRSAKRAHWRQTRPESPTLGHDARLPGRKTGNRCHRSQSRLWAFEVFHLIAVMGHLARGGRWLRLLLGRKVY